VAGESWRFGPWIHSRSLFDSFTSSRALGDSIRSSGVPPTAEQQAELARLSADVRTSGRIALALLILAVSAMATARYW
jgi:hypothetical protein